MHVVFSFVCENVFDEINAVYVFFMQFFWHIDILMWWQMNKCL